MRTIEIDGTVEPGPGLHLYRLSKPSQPVHCVQAPALCVIAQGSKEVLLGDEVYRYDPSQYLLTSMDLPVVSQVVKASVAKPYLGFKLEMDPSLIASVMVEAGIPSMRSDSSVKAMSVSSLDGGLLDAVVRLVRLVESESDYNVLAPLVIREIVYRLLVGEQGTRLRQMAVLGGHSHRIAKSVERLRTNLAAPLRIETIADELGMSVSSFHQHFKTVTSMSPLQFQKQLRLQEARRLMLAEDLDASSAAVRVGYDDPSHFSREYKRLFGDPPIRDIERLRDAATSARNPRGV